MAVSKVPQGSRMIITIQSGVNVSNQPVFRQRTYKSVKTTSVDADVYAIAEAMGSLQKYPVTSISRFDEGKLING